MRTTLVTATALALVIAGSALAQSPNGSSSGSSPSASSTSAPVQTAHGEWQASKLIGLDVYNGQNEKIGDIKELLTNKDGKIETVAIGVGGFLGLGTHNVAVKFSELKWVEEPVKTSSAAPNGSTTGSGGMGSSSNRGPSAGPVAINTAPAKKNYPDHAELNATKDQLKSMPNFDYTK